MKAPPAGRASMDGPPEFPAVEPPVASFCRPLSSFAWYEAHAENEELGPSQRGSETWENAASENQNVVSTHNERMCFIPVVPKLNITPLSASSRVKKLRILDAKMASKDAFFGNCWTVFHLPGTMFISTTVYGLGHILSSEA